MRHIGLLDKTLCIIEARNEKQYTDMYKLAGDGPPLP